jgi:hypothetical protein
MVVESYKGTQHACIVDHTESNITPVTLYLSLKTKLANDK